MVRLKENRGKGGAIAEAFRLLDAFTAKLTDAVGVFDGAGFWDGDHAGSMTAWLAHHCGLAPAGAHAMVHQARRLRELPVLAAF